jgi:anaerobic selenocysteine-containing dehydrogenase
MKKLGRREFLATGATAAGTLLASAGVVALSEADDSGPGARQRDIRKIPSACWQCVTRCPIIGKVEDGRIVKIEGNPASLATGGRICAKGQAGLNQVDNPDRLLSPMVRTGARGEGKWRAISWNEALGLLVDGGEIAGRRVTGLRALRDRGTPEKFLFHYGRTVGSDWTILMDYFLPAYGTGSVGNHDSICTAAGGIAGVLTGGGAPFRDFSKAEFILNFGNSVLEAGTDHVPTARRCVDALARGVRMVTFDARLSNTAAKSSEWIPIKPATDLAVALAMCHVIVEEKLFDASFIEAHTNVTVAELEAHLGQYTPEWAAEVSGVDAETIRSVAIDYATTRPGICLSARGAFMHHNGVQTQRALLLLQALSGNIDPNGRRAHSAQWVFPFATPAPATRKLPIFTGEAGQYSHPLAEVSHQLLHMIDKGPDRPELYMVYCHNPVYSNGDCEANARVLADVGKVPFLVAIDVGLSETSQLADLVLPDATYLERWTVDDKSTHEGVAEYQIRQPMHPPRGEARNFPDVAIEIAGRLGIELGFHSAEEFVRASCDATPGVREAGGFEFMKAHGVWSDPAPPGYGAAPGPMSIRSEALEKAGFAALPSWMAVPAHEQMADDELILVTFKVPTQTQSRTQNCKWLSELYHENSAWIHPDAAAVRGLVDGATAMIRSEVGEIEIKIRVTEGVHPRAIAISHHCGHWAQGEYASGRRAPFHRAEQDEGLRWWSEQGSHVNRIIPTRGDPIGGSMCWNDTLVTVEQAKVGQAAASSAGADAGFGQPRDASEGCCV